MSVQGLDLSVVKDFLFDVLGLGSKGLIGLDIGQHSIKIAEVFPVGRGSNKTFKLMKFHYLVMPEGTIIEDEVQNNEDFIELLKQVFDEAKIKNKNVCLGLSGPNTVCKRVQIGATDEQDLQGQIEWEAEQYIPFDQDEATLAHSIIGQNAGGGYDVMIAAIHNVTGETYQGFCSESGLKVKILDLNMFALNNVFEHVHSHNIIDNSPGILLIDFGAQTTKLVIYKNKAPIFTREMNLGGSNITEEIQRQLGESFGNSEELKKSGDDQGNLPEEILEIIEMNLDSFFEEIKKTIDFFLTASSEQGLSMCFITGGSALLPGLMEGLENILGIEVSLLNIFEKIEYEEKNFNEEHLNFAAHYGAVAVGLAMRSMDN
jgi:type IV pilus assembly protein PilM